MSYTSVYKRRKSAYNRHNLEKVLQNLFGEQDTPFVNQEQSSDNPVIPELLTKFKKFMDAHTIGSQFFKIRESSVRAMGEIVTFTFNPYEIGSGVNDSIKMKGVLVGKEVYIGRTWRQIAHSMQIVEE